MVTFAIDSDIISYILKRDEQVCSRWRQENQAMQKIVIPPIVYYEVKRWLAIIGAKRKMAEFQQLCAVRSDRPEIDISVWEKAIELYVWSQKSGQPMGDFDLLLAAYCLVNDFVLVTNNTRHFTVIAGLKLANWKAPYPSR